MAFHFSWNNHRVAIDDLHSTKTFPSSAYFDGIHREMPERNIVDRRRLSSALINERLRAHPFTVWVSVEKQSGKKIDYRKPLTIKLRFDRYTNLCHSLTLNANVVQLLRESRDDSY